MSMGCGIATFLVMGIESQINIATDIGILKKKNRYFFDHIPDAINLKCLYSVTQISQKLFEI